jgi:hypothetical protein
MSETKPTQLAQSGGTEITRFGLLIRGSSRSVPASEPTLHADDVDGLCHVLPVATGDAA